MPKYVRTAQDEDVTPCFVCCADTLDADKDFCSYECEKYWENYIKDLDYFEMQSYFIKEKIK